MAIIVANVPLVLTVPAGFRLQFGTPISGACVVTLPGRVLNETLTDGEGLGPYQSDASISITSTVSSTCYTIRRDGPTAIVQGAHLAQVPYLSGASVFVGESADGPTAPAGWTGSQFQSLVSGASKLQQFATRCKVPIAYNAGLKQAMTRSTHYARRAVPSFQIVIPNFHVLSGVETAQGAATSVTASIEYPLGTIAAQVTFSGAALGSIADKSYLVSDVIALALPINAQFLVRIWRSNAAGICYMGGAVPVMATDGFASGTTTPDLTMGGAITPATVNIFAPCGIIAPLPGRSVGVISDSVAYGSTDSTSDQSGDMGYIEKSLSPVMGVMNLGDPSDSAALFVTAINRANRVALLQYVTDLIVAFGTNDFSGGSAGALANLAAVVALFPNHRIWMPTVIPRSTSSDSWATVANQTTHADNATRIVVNSAIRQNAIAGVFGTFEVADAVESARNSGKFRIDDGDAAPAITVDGVHLITKGHRLIAMSNAVNPARLMNPA